MQGKETTAKVDAFYQSISSDFRPVSRDEVDGLLKFYSRIHHNIDIWHKAKNVRKNVTRIANSASKEEKPIYRAYAYELLDHVWFCAQKAYEESNDGREAANIFTARWMRSLKHLRGDHEDCEHEPVETLVDKLPDLDPTTTAFAQLSTYMKRVANMAEELCRFRHTGTMEIFHSTSLAYTPKRNDFDYDTMVARKTLAVLDHNHHVNRPLLVKSTTGADQSSSNSSSSNEPLCRNRWSKASKAYTPVFLKAPKDYTYVSHLMAAVLQLWVTSNYDFTNGTATPSPGHPRHIRKSIAPAAETPQQTYKRSRFPANRFHTSQSHSAAHHPVHYGDENLDEEAVTSSDDDEYDDEY